jgi:Family of unknown function (DUF5683)
LKTLTAFWKFLKCNRFVAIGVLLVCLAAPETRAQRDTVSTAKSDTSRYKRLDPRKALFYSAVFPGLGQMYNNKYWKLPFVYGGFAVTITVVNYYQKNYEKYRDELYTFLATGKSPNNLPESTLRYVVDKTRRERDYYIILTGIWYLLQVVDAHVDAHLQDFKFTRNLDITLRPSMNQNNMIGRTAGLTLTFKF